MRKEHQKDTVMASRMTVKKTVAEQFKREVRALQNNPQPEKAIEKLTNSILMEHYKARGDNPVNTYPHNTDGVITVGGAGLFADAAKSVLVETKQSYNFSTDKRAVSTVLTQVIAYLRKFRDAGDTVPLVSVIADQDEIFLIPTKTIMKYVQGDYQWDKFSPSEMHKDMKLFAALIQDKNIRPYVHDMSAAGFDVRLLCADVDRYVWDDVELERTPITTSNMVKLFNDFNFTVFNGDYNAISNQKQLEIFIRSMKGDEEVYAHPKKDDVLVMDGVEYSPVMLRNYEYFWNHYDNDNYTVDELKEITEICDQNLEDASRRFTGDFFTPKIWVDKSHEYIESVLGEDWKSKYIVWDCAAGVKNLTREYSFDNLYSSTLHEEELSVSADYNKNNVSFQYDFLNDDVELMHGGARPKGKKALEEWLESRPSKDEVLELAKQGQLKLPYELVEKMYKKKPIVFYTNPPYGSNGNQTKSDGRKGGIASTALLDVMPANYGHAKQELYTQFIYRVQLLAELFEYEQDFHFFFFFNKGFLTSPNFYNFNVGLTEQFAYDKGFMLNAGEFSGTSSAWGIIFAGWGVGGRNQREFEFDVLQSDKQTLEISKLTDWTGHMVGKGETISDWFREIEIGKSKVPAPLTKNGFDVPTSVRNCGKTGWIGSHHICGSNVQYSEKYIGMYSMIFSHMSGRDITPDNFTRAATTFSIRRSVHRRIAEQKLLWVRDKDIFTRPSEELLTDEFINDCVVFSLFDHQSRQTSLRDYECNGNTYQVYNEFFPFGREFVKQCAVASNNRAVQVDLDNDNRRERFVYEWLQDRELSEEAQNLYDYVKRLFELSMGDRVDHQVVFPRYQVNSWDAGWLQIRTLMFGRDRVSDEYVEKKSGFDERLKALGDKIADAAIADGVI